MLTIDFVKKLADEVNYWLRSLEVKIGASEKKLRQLERAIKNLLDLAEMHPSPELLVRLQQRERERDVEQNKLKRLQGQHQFL